jgi:hypothetical protein
MVKRFNEKTFSIDMPDGNTIVILCWTTNTREGFCHTAWCPHTDKKSRYSYGNRPWECYRYQTVLHKLFKKFPAANRKVFDDWDKKQEIGAKEEADNMFAGFKSAYDNTPQSLKDKLADSDIHLETKEDVQRLTTVMKLFTIMGE